MEAIPLRLLKADEVAQNLKRMGLDPNAYAVDPSHLVVRGEVFISRKEFERINREQEKRQSYESLRNTLSLRLMLTDAHGGAPPG